MGIVFSKDDKGGPFLLVPTAHSGGSSCLLQARACAYLCSSLGNDSCVHTRLSAHMCLHLHICVCVFVHVCLCAYAGVPLSFPHGLFCCFVSFSFSRSLQETNTGSLCPLLDLPSVPGDQVGGEMLFGNARPSSGSWASVLPHCRTEVGLLFLSFPWSQTSTRSSVLSSFCHLFSFVGPCEMATEMALSDFIA